MPNQTQKDKTSWKKATLTKIAVMQNKNILQMAQMKLKDVFQAVIVDCSKNNINNSVSNNNNDHNINNYHICNHNQKVVDGQTSLRF